MKKRIAKYVALLSLIMLIGTSCSSSPKDAHITQLIFNESITHAYLNGEAYTGKAWSEDGRTICLTCQEGDIKLVEVYHTNGNVAMRNTSLVGAGECFDQEGNAIDIADFVEQYPAITSRIQIMVENMLCSPDLK